MGIFSDEPQVSPRRDVTEADAFIPYSPWMEPAFKERYGYDLRPHLASLVDTTGDWRTFRLHYYRTVGACMEKAFIQLPGALLAGQCALRGLFGAPGVFCNSRKDGWGSPGFLTPRVQLPG